MTELVYCAAVAFTMTERANQLHYNNAPAHSTALVQAFLAKLHNTNSCRPLYSPDLDPCDFWFFPKIKSPLKGRRFVNATVTQYTISVNGVSLPTDQPHGRVTVHGRTVRSPLTGCQVTSKSRDRFSRYSNWPDTFRTALVLPSKESNKRTGLVCVVTKRFNTDTHYQMSSYRSLL